MSDILDQALGQIAAGDAAAREGFGFARVTTAGVRTAGGIFEWEDHLEIRGDGVVVQTNFRSFADNPGDRPGVYELRMPVSAIGCLARLIREAGLDSLAAGRVGIADTIIRLDVVAGGAAIERAFAARDEAALQLLQPLLNAFIPLTQQLQAHPAMALDLQLKLDAAPQMPVGPAQLTGALRFGNPGQRGFWITHPAALKQDGRFERCDLVYGRLPVIEPDVMPRPVELLQARLTPRADRLRRLIWLPPGGEALVACTAPVAFPEPGHYFVRASFATYQGGVSIGGQTHFQGAVFSKDLAVEVA